MNYRLAYGGYVRRFRHTSAVTRIIILYLVSAIGVSDYEADLGDVSSLSLTFRRFVSSKEIRIKQRNAKVSFDPPRAIYLLGKAYSGALIAPDRC